MRFDGKLEKWNDDRGFGFIMPTRGGDTVFVHISAFPHDGRRPQVGEVLSFEVEPAGDGKRRAINVQRPGSFRPRAALAPAPVGDSRARRQPRQGNPLPTIALVVAALLGIGIAYSQFADVFSDRLRARGLHSVPSAAPATAPAPEAASPYRCDGRIHCSQMSSCEEAKFFLKNCPGTKMDGDHDGVPCETQWCR
jgi:cold shock CspA family protein